jgi:hypothetical protein
MERQAQRIQAAESARTEACSKGATAECSEFSRQAQREAETYRRFKDQYRGCLQRPSYDYRVGGYHSGSYSGRPLFDPLVSNGDYR